MLLVMESESGGYKPGAQLQGRQQPQRDEKGALAIAIGGSAGSLIKVPDFRGGCRRQYSWQWWRSISWGARGAGRPGLQLWWLTMCGVLVVVLGGGTLTGVWCQSESTDGSFTFRPADGVQGFNCSVFCGHDSCASNPGCLNVVDSNSLQLIPNSNNNNSNNIDLAARFMRAQPVRLWATSFWTFFIFRVSNIKNPPNSLNVGDGFVFLIAPDWRTPSWTGGDRLGLFENGSNGTTGEPSDGKDSRIVGIKVDTFQNSEDSPTPYLGLVINNIRPVVVWPWSDASSTALPAPFVGGTFGVWVEYDVGSQKVTLSMLNVTQPVGRFSASDLRRKATVLFSSGLNVTDRVAELSYVGFSASTGPGTIETNEIFYWQFQMGESSALSSPGPAAGPTPAAAGPPAAGPAAAGPAPVSVALVVAVTVSCALVLVLAIASAVLLLCCCRKRKMAGGKMMSSANLTTLHPSAREFSYDELRMATDNFAETSVLGEGGCGKVFKGHLKDGRVRDVAVKRISERSSQGHKQFLAEVTIIGKLRHQSLVPLLGWCLNTSKGELLLVYEYMPNGSLDRHVLRQDLTAGQGSSTTGTSAEPSPAPVPETVLSWDVRYRVLHNVASALLYLHEDWQEGGGDLKEAVLHRDIKSSNVMLDANWNGRLGDFGMARFVHKDRHSETASAIVGTLGYVAPEYAWTNKVSVFTDVYSFGVLVLEVVTGRRPFDSRQPHHKQVLVHWLRSVHQAAEREGAKLESAADPALGMAFDAEQLVLLLRLGLLCTADDPKRRPSMRSVVQALPISTNLTYTNLAAITTQSIYGSNWSSPNSNTHTERLERSGSLPLLRSAADSQVY